MPGKRPGGHGRKKIEIKTLEDPHNRKVTFTKRKIGLMKKAYELGVLCNCEIALIIIDPSDRVYEFGNNNVSDTVLRYTNHATVAESQNNDSIERIINKEAKKNGGVATVGPDAFTAATAAATRAPLPFPPFASLPPDGLGHVSAGLSFQPSGSVTPGATKRYQELQAEFQRLMPDSSNLLAGMPGFPPPTANQHGGHPSSGSGGQGGFSAMFPGGLFAAGLHAFPSFNSPSIGFPTLPTPPANLFGSPQLQQLHQQQQHQQPSHNGNNSSGGGAVSAAALSAINAVHESTRGKPFGLSVSTTLPVRPNVAAAAAGGGKPGLKLFIPGSTASFPPGTQPRVHATSAVGPQSSGNGNSSGSVNASASPAGGSGSASSQSPFGTDPLGNPRLAPVHAGLPTDLTGLDLAHSALPLITPSLAYYGLGAGPTTPNSLAALAANGAPSAGLFSKTPWPAKSPAVIHGSMAGDLHLHGEQMQVAQASVQNALAQQQHYNALLSAQNSLQHDNEDESDDETDDDEDDDDDNDDDEDGIDEEEENNDEEGSNKLNGRKRGSTARKPAPKKRK